jgi:hypothetical protein
MLNTSIAINKKFDSNVQKKIEAALGKKNIFDVVKYYYSIVEDLDYSIIFFRGKKAPSWDYISILTRSFEIKGIACASDERSVVIDFYNSGESVFNIETTHPHEMSLEGKFHTNIGGDIHSLTQFGNNIDLEKLDQLIHGTGNYFFFPKSYTMDIFKNLGLYNLYPMLFWDYDSITRAQKKHGSLDTLVGIREFINLREVRIKPSY